MLWLTLCFFSLSIAFLFHHRSFKDVWTQVDFLTDRIKELENEIDLLNKELAKNRELETKVASLDETTTTLDAMISDIVDADCKRSCDDRRFRARLADILGEFKMAFSDDAGVDDIPQEANAEAAN